MNISVALVLFLVCQGYSVLPGNKFSLESIDNCGNKQPSDDDAVVLRGIINNFLKKYFSDDKILISLVILPSKTEQNRDFFYFLFNNQASIEFTYKNLGKLDNTTRDSRNTLNLIVVDDSKQLQNAWNESNVQEFHLNQKFLIVVTGNALNNTKTIDEAFTLLWKNGLINSNVLVQDAAKSWSLYTFLPYQDDCIALKHLKIESFTETNFSDLMNLSIDQVYPQKLNNFNGCPLYIIPKISYPLVILANTSDGAHRFKGYEVSIANAVAQALNFTPIYKFEEEQNVTRFLNLVVKGEMDFTLGISTDVEERRRILSATNGYFYHSTGFVYKDGNLRTSATGTLTAPFSPSLWLIIVAILLFSILIILMSKRLTRKWRHFYIGGRMNRTAILNTWVVVLGHSIANPQILNGRSIGNFARTLLILWIFMWFFIRSWYEGAFYSFLQSQPPSPYDTVEKVLASNCEIIAPDAIYPYIKDLVPKNRGCANSHTKNNQKLDVQEKIREFKSDGIEIMSDIHDNEDDRVVIVSQNKLKYFNLINIPHRRLSFTRLFMKNSVFYFRMKSFLRPLFNREFGRLNRAGLIEFWISSYVDDRRIKLKHRTSIQRTYLQIDTIYGALQISAVLYFISFVVFVLEVLSVVFFRIKDILDFLTY